MLKQRYRQAYQTLLIDPFLKLYFIRRLNPLSITLISCLSGCCIVPFLFVGYEKWALTALIFSGFCDTLDGSLARLNQCASPRGAALDIVCDRIVEFSIIMGLYMIDPIARSVWVIWMLGSILICVTSFLVVGIFTTNTSSKSFYYSPGLMERAEAFFFFALMILMPSLFSNLALLFIILTFFTGFFRLWQFMKHN